jgi:hypothetical protein
MNTCIWVIGDGVLGFKKKFLQVPVVTTHVELLNSPELRLDDTVALSTYFVILEQQLGPNLLHFYIKRDRQRQ